MDTTYSVREDFSKETVEIRKRLWMGSGWKVARRWKVESMQLENTTDFSDL